MTKHQSRLIGYVNCLLDKCINLNWWVYFSFCYWLAILAIPSTAYGQTYNLERHFNEKINGIDQSQDGLMWLATPTGVVVYDLNIIRRVPYENKGQKLVLDTKKILAIKNEIFSLTANNVIYRYDEKRNVFYPYYQRGRVFDIQCLNGEYLVIADEKQVIKINIENNEEHIVYRLEENKLIKNFEVMIACLSNQIIIKDKKKLVIVSDTGQKKVREYESPDLFFVKEVSEKLYAVQNLRADRRNIQIFNQSHKIVDSFPYSLPALDQNIIEVDEGYLYKDEESFIYDKDNKLVKKIKIYFLGEDVKIAKYFLFKDRNKNLWVGMDKGLFLLNNYTRLYEVKKIEDTYLAKNTSRMFLKDKINYLSLDDNGKMHWFFYSPLSKQTYRVLHQDHPINTLNLSINYDESFAFYSNEKIIHYYLGKKQQDAKILNDYLASHNLAINKVHVPKDKIFVITDQNVLLLYDHQTSEIKTFETTENIAFNYLNYKYQGEEDVLFLFSGSLAFLNYHKNTCEVYSFNDKQKHLIQYATDFYFFENKLFLTTRNKGLLIIDLITGEESNVLGEEIGLYSIFKDSRDNFWMNGDGFLAVYNYQYNQVESFYFPKFEEDDYFVKNAYKGDTFYVSTQKYIVSVHTNQYKPRDFESEILVNKIDYFDGKDKVVIVRPEGEEISLPAGSQNINLFLYSPDFSLNKTRKVKYRVNDGPWFFYKDFISINQNSFKPGNFNVLVRDEEIGVNIFEKKILIEPYWYQTWLANLLFIFLCTSVFVAFFILYRDKIKADFKLRSVEEKTKIKLDFIAKVSHEIRTPINAIIGFSDLLRNSLFDTDSVKKYSETIYFSGNILLHLVNDILYKSSIDAKKVKFVNEDFELHTTLHKTREVFALQVQEKKIGFSLVIDPSTPNLVNGDKNKLTQVLSNLIQNAIKFTDKGAIVLYSKLKAYEGGKIIIDFSVKDTGVGIPKHLQHKLFESFVQLHADSKPDEGTGLGLMISKEIINIGGGEMYFCSEENVGSTFGFILPFGYPDPTLRILPEEKVITKPNQTKFNVLIAEDEKFNSILINKIVLTQFPNASITNVENGVEAISELKSNTFDVIILDVNMPKIGGIEVAQYVRNEMRDFQKKLVCCTASAEINQWKSVNKYFDYFVAKPYTRQELLAVIENIIEPKKEK